MPTKNRSIIDKLSLKEKLDRKILNAYKKVLDPAFLIIYGVSYADIDWNRIIRLSNNSNFIIVSGTSIIPKGTLVHGNKTDRDITINQSFTIPWELLDNGASPNLLAKSASDIKVFSEIADVMDFNELMRSPDFTYDDIKLFLPDYDKIEQGKTPDIPIMSTYNKIDPIDILIGQVRATILESDDK